MPALYSKNDDGTWREARMDVVVEWPCSSSTRLLDLSVRSPFNQSLGTEVAKRGGVAADRAVNDKRSRYGSTVTCVAIEVGGRLSAPGAACLRALAADARTYGRVPAAKAVRLRAHSR